MYILTWHKNLLNFFLFFNASTTEVINNKTYREYKWEISSSSFPNLQSIVIDSSDNMLVPKIPTNLSEQLKYSKLILNNILSYSEINIINHGKILLILYCQVTLSVITKEKIPMSFAKTCKNLTMVTLGFRALTDSSTNGELKQRVKNTGNINKVTVLKYLLSWRILICISNNSY